MIIEEYLKKVALFKTITADQLHIIADSAEIVTFSQDDLIIEEGGLAKALYVILLGSVQVFTQDKDGNEVVLARLDVGSYFGEQGYLNNLIRTASVKAITKVELIKVNYSVLDPIFQKSAALRKYLEKTSLERSIANLQSQLKCIDSYVKEIFTKKSLFSSADEAVIKHFKKGEILFNQGDEPDYVYFISSGTVELIFTEPASKIIINKNHMFGEVGVVQNKPRSATARALTNTAVIAVSDKNFLNAIKKASKLKSLVMAFSNVYTLPKNKAVVEQFIGKFQHSEAIFTKYKLQSGQVAVCAKVVDQPIFMIKMNDVIPDNTLQFKRGELIERTIQLKDHAIVGITAIGEWSEISILCEMLLVRSKNLWVNSINILSYKLKELFTNRVVPSMIKLI
ncbi:MAG: cyclic nucleotide-binding domain-containing protein, partial [Gammaproteobacteria bacterium]